jgi:hypothetical protein
MIRESAINKYFKSVWRFLTPPSPFFSFMISLAEFERTTALVFANSETYRVPSFRPQGEISKKIRRNEIDETSH